MLSDMQGIRGLKRSSNKNRAVLRRVAGEGELALRVFVLSFHCAPRSRLIPLICNLQFYNRMGKRSLAARIRVLCSLSNINAKQKPRGTNALKTLTSGARTRRSFWATKKQNAFVAQKEDAHWARKFRASARSQKETAARVPLGTARREKQSKSIKSNILFN